MQDKTKLSLSELRKIQKKEH